MKCRWSLLWICLLSLTAWGCNELDETVPLPVRVDGAISAIDFNLIYTGIAQMDRVDPRDWQFTDPAIATNNPNPTHQRYRVTISSSPLVEAQEGGLRYFAMDRNSDINLIMEVRFDLYAPIIDANAPLEVNLLGGYNEQSRRFEWIETTPPLTVTEDFFMSEALVTIIDQEDPGRNRTYRISEGYLELSGSGLRLSQNSWIRGSEEVTNRSGTLTMSRVSDVDPLYN